MCTDSLRWLLGRVSELALELRSVPVHAPSTTSPCLPVAISGQKSCVTNCHLCVGQENSLQMFSTSPCYAVLFFPSCPLLFVLGLSVNSFQGNECVGSSCCKAQILPKRDRGKEQDCEPGNQFYFKFIHELEFSYIILANVLNSRRAQMGGDELKGHWHPPWPALGKSLGFLPLPS